MKLLATAILALGVTTPAWSQSQSAGGSVMAGPGRFVLGQLSGFRRDQYLLDTQTGRVWILSCLKPNEKDSNSCDVPALVASVFVDATGNVGGYLPPSVPAGTR